MSNPFDDYDLKNLGVEPMDDESSSHDIDEDRCDNCTLYCEDCVVSGRMPPCEAQWIDQAGREE
jgi:hypothetical protein